MCVAPLLAAGYSVLSEESGSSIRSRSVVLGTVVVDPLRRLNNASLGLPWSATSLCLVIDGAPVAAMVANLATGAQYTALRGGGATLDGRSISIATTAPLDDAIIAISGLPESSLRLAPVPGDGRIGARHLCGCRWLVDGFVDMSPDAHGVWDYLGGMLVVQEAGGVVVDALGRNLVVIDHGARRRRWRPRTVPYSLRSSPRR